MFNRLITLSLFFILTLINFSNLATAREYDCKDMPLLQSRIKKGTEIKSLSVAATIIRFMGRNPNSCVKTIKESSDAAEVQYLGDSQIVTDTFNFTKSNLVVSWVRNFKDGTTEIVNF